MSPSTTSQCSTQRFLQVLGNIHDVDQQSGSHNACSRYSTVLQSHWCHLALVFSWVSSVVFHIGWHSNFTAWVSSPSRTAAVAHSIFDPRLGTFDTQSIASTSGAHSLSFTVGHSSSSSLHALTCSALPAALSTLTLAMLHAQSPRALSAAFARSAALCPVTLTPVPAAAMSTSTAAPGSRLNCRTGGLFGSTSLAWAGHLVHVSLPTCRGLQPFSSASTWSSTLDKDNHVWGSSLGAGAATLTFTGTLRQDSTSMPLSDIVHHHLAIGFCFAFASHLLTSYSSMVIAQPQLPSTLTHCLLTPSCLLP